MLEVPVLRCPPFAFSMIPKEKATPPESHLSPNHSSQVLSMMLDSAKSSQEYSSSVLRYMPVAFKVNEEGNRTLANT